MAGFVFGALMELEQAVEAYLEFLHTPPGELSYEARQEIRAERLRDMIRALTARKALERKDAA